MSGTLSPDVIAAINNIAATPLGRKYDRMARQKYGVSGKKLAAKEVVGESGGKQNAVSSAGARGYTQFMPGTRADYLKRFGVDAWAGPNQAVKAMELYQTAGGGVESYNPGMPSYAQYILGQKLDPATRRALAGGVSATGTAAGGSAPQLPDIPGTPGQSFAADRDTLRKQLLLTPGMSLSKLLSYKEQMDGLKDVPGTSGIKAPKMPTDVEDSNSAPVGKGSFTLSATAMKPGTSLAPIQKSALRYLSGRVGQTLEVGTGTNHNRLTVNGNVSDHYDGHASDIPSSGSALTKLGQQALIAFGMSRREALQKQGGLFNLQWKGHRVQVIFNTMEGGNHYTHLHLGVR